MPRLLPALALAACAASLGGCVTIKGQSEAQMDTIGSVRVTTTLCLSHAPANPGTCPDTQSNSQVDAGTSGAGQLLVAYRVPDAVVPPAAITASYVSPQTGFVTLDRSASYSSEMQQKAPAVAGERWVGYISPIVTNADQVPNARARIVADLGLARGSDGSPFAGPLHYRVVAGVRAAGNATEAARPAVCNDDVTKNTVGEAIYCVDTPTANENAFAADDRSIATKDLGVLNGASATTKPGTAASMSFTVRSVGLNGSPVFNLSAGTTVPGGSASPVQSVFAPDAADLTVPVSIGVPAGTPPGNYDVTLSANTSGQLRTGHGTLTVAGPGVKPPGVSKPKLKLSLGKKPKLGAALKQGLKVKVGCDVACAITVKLGKLGGGKGSLKAAGTKSVVAKFTSKARRKYRSRRKLAFTLSVAATGAGGTSTRTQHVVLKR